MGFAEENNGPHRPHIHQHMEKAAPPQKGEIEDRRAEQNHAREEDKSSERGSSPFLPSEPHKATQCGEKKHVSAIGFCGQVPVGG